MKYYEKKLQKILYNWNIFLQVILHVNLNLTLRYHQTLQQQHDAIARSIFRRCKEKERNWYQDRRAANKFIQLKFFSIIAQMPLAFIAALQLRKTEQKRMNEWYTVRCKYTMVLDVWPRAFETEICAILWARPLGC